MEPLFSALSSHLWAFWIIAAAVLAILEMLVPSFTFIFAAAASLFAAVASVRLGLGGQIVVFSGALVAAVALFRPRMLEKFHSAQKIPSRAQALLGKQGSVTQAIDPVTRAGRVLVDGQDWAAQCETPVDTGKTIVVEGSDGIVLTVKES